MGRTAHDPVSSSQVLTQQREQFASQLSQSRPRSNAPTTTRPRSELAARPTTAGGHRDHRIMALAEGRGVAAEVGVCIIHATTGECILSQVPDSQSYARTLHKIHLNDPHKILMANTALEAGASQLYQLIEHHIPDTSIIAVPRKYFNNDSGMKAIQDFGLLEDAAALLLGLSSKYYCLAAVAAAFRYVSEHEGISFVDHTVKFSFQGVEGSDIRSNIVTAKNLEIVSNTVNRSSKDTLFGVVDHTVTPMGARLLRTNLLQPSTNEDVIQGRLDAVQELVSRESFLFNVQSALKPVTDLDHIIADIAKIPVKQQDVHYAECKINHVIRLKTMMTALKSVATSLQSCSNTLLVTICEILSDSRLDDLQMAISETLHDDVGIQKTSLGLRHQRCYAVKSGVNGLLDVARQTYKETIEDIYELATEYTESSGLNIKLQFNAPKGFYLSLPADQLEESTILPQVFINVVKKKKQYTFTTLELLQKNSRMNESLTEVYLMSDKTVTDLLQVFRADIGVLYKVSEAIAMLDMLLSFGHCCSLSEYVRPEFTNTLAIEAGRHPIMERIQQEPVIPNDTYTSLSSSFQLITGPNMSGKSTYIKQIGLLTIMAQAGSFVPATYASFRLCDQILSRLGNDVYVEVNTSSFMAEMREAAYIIQNVTNSSLVIIDELGKGTAPYDALGIAASISEYLIKSKAYCFFTTHLHQLTRVLSVYPNVVNLQLKVDIVSLFKALLSKAYGRILSD
ncbi:DNA mismatch repair protein Msh4 [Zychaea mexicana]|uniref:DNA mismatch repair protein Msh4 n=1 Tax=Zychaea mexicana TaxID=64656 RepID=UPI0022FE9FA2|nr:DNA mismatch repair protein Msh4 [Zychaea mexicana]KAI9493031.1 DNA mismatch repair protein Msh4 [Zychaea mexicana]